MTRPWQAMDIPLSAVEADIAAAQFEYAAAHSSTPQETR